MTRRELAIENMLTWIREHIDDVPYRCGIFNTANTVKDTTVEIYNKGGIGIDACYEWEYIEIFGLDLDDDEFEEIKRRIIEIGSEEEYDEEE